MKRASKKLSKNPWINFIWLIAILLAALFYQVSPEDILNGNFGKNRHIVESHAQLQPSKIREEGKVRVCIWNVHCYLDTYRMKDGKRIKSPKPEAEKTELIKILNDINADVLGIEEIGGKPYAKEFQLRLSQSGLNYPYLAVSSESSEYPQCAIFSKIPFEKINILATKPFDYFGEKIRSPRGMLIVDFSTNGKNWRFGSVHLKSKFGAKARDKENNLFRQKEAKAISKDMSKFLRKGGLAIIGGDFNEEPTDGTIKILEKSNFVTLKQQNPNGEAFSYYWAKGNQYRQFDFFMISKSMQKYTDKATVLPIIKSASDHAPVFTDLDFSRGLSP